MVFNDTGSFYEALRGMRMKLITGVIGGESRWVDYKANKVIGGLGRWLSGWNGCLQM